MIIRFLYAWLLRLHPRHFRELFAEEMLATFEEAAAERAVLPLFADGMASLARQWMFRSESHDPLAASGAVTHTIDHVPVFYLEEQSLPDLSSILSGGAVSVLILLVACILVSKGGNPVTIYQTYARSRQTPEERIARPSSPPNFKTLTGKLDKPATSVDDVRPADAGEHWTLVSNSPKVPGIAQPRDPSPSKLARNYIHAIRLLAALDANGDGIISAAEIANAPIVLQKLDRNHDGKLTPEECGFGGFPPGIDLLTPGDTAAAEQRRRFLERARPAFMRFHPVIAALDADHDGVISADEIRQAAMALRTLDRNGDGQITEEEFLPDPVENQVTLIMSRLDVDGDGQIAPGERTNPFGEHYRDLLDHADANHDGIVTGQELRNEIRRRADLNRDGMVTWREMLETQQSGALVPFAREK